MTAELIGKTLTWPLALFFFLAFVGKENMVQRDQRRQTRLGLISLNHISGHSKVG